MVGTVTNTSVFNSTGLGWVKRDGEASNGGGTAGWTKILLRAQNDMFNVAPIVANSIRASYNTAESSNPPSLTVVWEEATGFKTVIRPVQQIRFLPDEDEAVTLSLFAADGLL